MRYGFVIPTGGPRTVADLASEVEEAGWDGAFYGDGICVGRDSASPVSPDYKPPFAFTGGTIDKVIVDVTGEPYIDHEAQVRAWFMRD